jgi:hypothetical protein
VSNPVTDASILSRHTGHVGSSYNGGVVCWILTSFADDIESTSLDGKKGSCRKGNAYGVIDDDFNSIDFM